MPYRGSNIVGFTMLLAAGLACAPDLVRAQEARDDYPPLRSSSSIFDEDSAREVDFSADDDRYESAITDSGAMANRDATAYTATPSLASSAANRNANASATTNTTRTGRRTINGAPSAGLPSLPQPRGLERLPRLRTSDNTANITTASTSRADVPATGASETGAPPTEPTTTPTTSVTTPAPGFPVVAARGTEPGEGLRLGAFTLYGEVTESVVHTSRRGESTEASWGFRVAPDLRLLSNWPRHELAFILNGSATAWTKSGKEKAGVEKEGSAGAALRLDARRHVRLRLGASHAITETRIGSNKFQHDTDAAAAVEHERYRLRLSALAGVRRHVEPDAKTDDYTAPRIGLHARLRTAPALALYGTLGADMRLHDEERDASGAKRDSKGLQVELGVEWLRGPMLEGRMGVRAEVRDYEQPGVKSLAGVGAAGQLTWRPRRSTTVEAEASFGLNDDGGANPSREQTLALSVQQVLRRGLDWSGRAETTRTDVRAGNDRLALRLETSLAWRIHRRLWIVGGYEFEKEFEENTPDQKPIHTVHVGLRQRF